MAEAQTVARPTLCRKYSLLLDLHYLIPESREKLF